MSNSVGRFIKLHKYSILLSIGSIFFYWVFAYLLEREDFIRLFCLYGALFFFYYQLIRFEKWNFNFLLVAGILFRLVFLVAEPNLSQDFFRFIWDGELIKNGTNPYLFTPNELIKNQEFRIPNASVLYVGMGELSAMHYSNYPPVNQLFFTISAFLGKETLLGSILVLRILLILADVGILLIGRKLLLHFNLPVYTIYWYFLNPLVIIELTGNLHFEGTMLFFFTAAIYLLVQQKWGWAAILYGFSIMIKLIPILFLPFFLRYLGFKKSIGFYLLVLVSCLLTFLPFYSPDFLAHYSKTISLWFSNFEFNASIYNLVKHIGITYYDAKPWELIKSYGKAVPIITVGFALLLVLFQKDKNIKSVIGSSLWLLSIYFFLTSTLHPWYLAFIILLTVFTDYRYPILWSAVVILSYFAYSRPDFRENLYLITIEYFLVFSYLGYEFVKLKPILFNFREKNNS